VDHAEQLVIKPRLLPRVGATLALAAMAVCVAAIYWLDHGLGLLNLAGLLLPTYVIFDRCISCYYSISPAGIEVHGLRRRPHQHARGELVNAHIRKGALSSTLILDFGQKTLELHEYLLGESLVEISEFIEQTWGVRVTPQSGLSGVQPGTQTELT
jgi:hypothetical protein